MPVDAHWYVVGLLPMSTVLSMHDAVRLYYDVQEYDLVYRPSSSCQSVKDSLLPLRRR